MTLRRKLAFALAAIVLSLAASVVALLAVDTWVHHKFDDVGGLNRRGYRGKVVGAKAPGEWRAVVLGGSTALGYGVPAHQAFPAQLEAVLRQQHPASVVNLAWNSEGAYAMRPVLEDYAGLKPDVAILYGGYNDLPSGRVNTLIYRRESAVFRMTGYYPLLPLVLHEKLMAMRYGGDLEAAYRGKGRPVVFHPNAGQQTTIGALAAADKVSDALAGQLGRLSPSGSGAAPPSDEAHILSEYVEHICDAVRWARAHGQRVIVVGQPFISDSHVRQQATLAAAIASRFGSDPGVRYVSLGRLIDLNDRSLSIDGSHLTVAGNGLVARTLAPVVTAMLQP